MGFQPSLDGVFDLKFQPPKPKEGTAQGTLGQGEVEENAGEPIIAKEDKEEAGADAKEPIIAKEEKEINREDLEKKREEKIIYRDTALTYSTGAEPRYRWNLEEDGGEIRLITYYTNKAREMYDKFVQ